MVEVGVPRLIAEGGSWLISIVLGNYMRGAGFNGGMVSSLPSAPDNICMVEFGRYR